MFRFAGGQSPAAGGLGHLVGEADHARIRLLDPGADDHFFVVEGRRMIAARSFHHRQPDAVPGLHVAIADAGGAAVFDASDFHPDQVVRVVHDAHLVGFGIAHSQPRVDGFHGG